MVCICVFPMSEWNLYHIRFVVSFTSLRLKNPNFNFFVSSHQPGHMYYVELLFAMVYFSFTHLKKNVIEMQLLQRELPPPTPPPQKKKKKKWSKTK